MRWSALLVSGGLLVAACSHGSSGAGLKPHPLAGGASAVVDYSGISLQRVPGSTTTTAVPKGTASIVGSVSGPSGLVPGATVRIERLADAGTVRTDVTTGADGRFNLPNVPGGRYRVRAFLAPALALTTPEVRFIEDAKPATFDLTMTDQRKVVARAAVAPSVPYIGDDVDLAVVVANQSVDSDGIVRSTPLPGLQVELDGLGAYQLASPNRGGGGVFFPRTTTTTQPLEPSTVAFTDGNGQVDFALQCTSAAAPDLDLLVTVTVTPTPLPGQPPPAATQQVQHLPLTVPVCIDPSTVTSTSTPSSTGSTGPSNQRTTTTSSGTGPGRG